MGYFLSYQFGFRLKAGMTLSDACRLFSEESPWPCQAAQGDENGGGVLRQGTDGFQTRPYGNDGLEGLLATFMVPMEVVVDLGSAFSLTLKALR